MAKRSRLEIIRDILVVARPVGGIKPTRLLYASNLSPQMFKEYVAELLGKGLIRKKILKKGYVFLLTKKGSEFLEQYRTIENFIDSFGL